MSSQPAQVNSATIIIGNSGTGKSSLGATLAEYLWETFGKVLLYYSADGGGFPARVQALQRLGLVRLFRMRSRGNPFETSINSSRGWWPSRINPATGEVAPGVRMVPPLTQTLDMYCDQGHKVRTASFQAQLVPTFCKECKKQVTLQTARVERAVAQTRGFEAVGGVFFDSLSAMLSWQMVDLAGRTGRLELKGEEAAIGGRIVDGDMALGGSNRSHYGFVQTRAEEMATNSLSIPNLVVPPVFTALLLESTDQGGLLIKGPKLAGQAKTAESPQWFGNCLEATVAKTEKDEQVFRLYLKEYIDSDGARHLCKNRAAPGSLPDYLEDPPDPSLAFSQFNLGLFFKLLEQGTADTEKAMTEKYPTAPGVPQGEISYGDEGDGKAPAPVAAASPAARAAAAPSAAARPAARAAGAKPANVHPTAAPHPADTEGQDALNKIEADTAPQQVDATATPGPAAVSTPAASAPAVPSASSSRPSPSIAGRPFAPPPAPRPPARAPRPPATIRPSATTTKPTTN